jgi:putative Mn2+ efflux pump MntP
MSFFEVLLIALSMAMDAFAVCLGAGTQPDTKGLRPTFRLAFHFGLFQFLMPVLGWLGGTTISEYISSFDHWIAFGLLIFVGARMIRSGLNPDGDAYKNNPSRGLTMVMLSIAVSIDALAIGLTLAFLKVSVWYPAIVIGIVTGLMSWLGVSIGNRLGEKFGKVMEVVGGIILALIGIRIVVSHLLI